MSPETREKKAFADVNEDVEDEEEAAAAAPAAADEEENVD